MRSAAESRYFATCRHCGKSYEVANSGAGSIGVCRQCRLKPARNFRKPNFSTKQICGLLVAIVILVGIPVYLVAGHALSDNLSFAWERIPAEVLLLLGYAGMILTVRRFAEGSLEKSALVMFFTFFICAVVWVFYVFIVATGGTFPMAILRVLGLLLLYGAFRSLLFLPMNWKRLGTCVEPFGMFGKFGAFGIITLLILDIMTTIRYLDTHGLRLADSPTASVHPLSGSPNETAQQRSNSLPTLTREEKIDSDAILSHFVTQFPEMRDPLIRLDRLDVQRIETTTRMLTLSNDISFEHAKYIRDFAERRGIDK